MMYSFLLRKFVMPIITHTSPYKAWKYFHEYMRSEYLPREEIERQQWDKITSLINHAYKNVPFYKKKFDKAKLKPSDVNTKEDFLRIPITTKKEIYESSLRYLIAKNYRKQSLRVSHTSGTTGRGTMLIQDRTAINHQYAAKLRSRKMEGIDIGDSILRITPNECRACIRGGVFPGNTFNTFIKSLLFNKRDKSSSFYSFLENNIIQPYFHRRTYLRPFKEDGTYLDDSELSFYVNKVNNNNAALLMVYPLYLFLFAKYIRRKKIEPKQFKAIDFSGGLVTKSMKKLISETFNVKAYECYGSCENSRIASECEKNNGLMHILETFCYTEFIKPDGSPAKENELANIIVTNLENYAMPAIRLEVGDVGWYTNKLCSCGRKTKLMNVEGRIQSVIKTKEGKTLSGKFLWDKFLNFKGIRLFQLIQHDTKKYEFKIVKEKNVSSIDEKNLIKKLKNLLGQNIKIILQYVDYIQQESSGKFMLVKSTTFNEFRPKDIKKIRTKIN